MVNQMITDNLTYIKLYITSALILILYESVSTVSHCLCGDASTSFIIFDKNRILMFKSFCFYLCPFYDSQQKVAS